MPTNNPKKSCFHCGDQLPAGSNWQVDWKEIPRDMCCPGCEAVCQTIIESGLDEYYLHRQNNPQKPQPLIPEELRRLQSYNQAEISQAYIQSTGQLQQAIFYIEGMTCAACAWLIEKKISKLPFVENISVNAISNLASISWRIDSLKVAESKNDAAIPMETEVNSRMGDILYAVSSSGYSAKPLLPEQLATEHKLHQKSLLKRLGVAGLGMMQVMMFAVGLYSGAFQGMDDKFENLLRWFSFLISTPVVFYSAAPFFKSAWNNIKTFDLGMNVPVSLAIGSAYFASGFATITKTGEVYFDSVVMFTFFLLVGRFIQSRAGWRASETNLTTNLAIAPSIQTQIDGEWKFHAVNQLNKDDLILVVPGEAIPVDGIIHKGESEISTAIINGEFKAKLCKVGDEILAASINQTQPLEIICHAVGSDRFIEKLARRQQQALAEKPALVSLADNLSHWFVLSVLSASTITAIYWYLTSPEDAFWITLSVLVVSCPCALSLATPAAITAAIARASKIGFIINKPEFLEQLVKCDWIAFDKTGTLTQGELTVSRIVIFDSDYTETEILNLSAAMEIGSSHPIARAILNAASKKVFAQKVNSRKEIPGKGISANIDNRNFKLGYFDINPAQEKLISLYLEDQPLAEIYLNDPWREDSMSSLQHLKKIGYKVALLTGDPCADSEELRERLQIDEVITAASAEDKQNWVKQKQSEYHCVLMVGDGINDGPVLAQADTSIAMSSGAALSKTGSNATLLNGRISSLVELFELSKNTRKIIKQNLIWALLYNATTIPLAANGNIPPWLAAIGMSLSSLFVVLNALRLNTKRDSNG